MVIHLLAQLLGGALLFALAPGWLAAGALALVLIARFVAQWIPAVALVSWSATAYLFWGLGEVSGTAEWAMAAGAAGLMACGGLVPIPSAPSVRPLGLVVMAPLAALLAWSLMLPSDLRSIAWLEDGSSALLSAYGAVAVMALGAALSARFLWMLRRDTHRQAAASDHTPSSVTT